MLPRRIAYAPILISVLVSATVAASPFGAPVRDFSGAVPVGEDQWIVAEDYPTAALRNEDEGRVVVVFTITAKGKVSNCRVETSSGHAALDDVPCAVLPRRARFKPLRDEHSVPVEVEGRYSVDFWLPE